jgi:hypothetical protein
MHDVLAHRLSLLTVHAGPLDSTLTPRRANELRSAGMTLHAQLRRRSSTHPRPANAASVDRLTFAGQIIETGTTSYRLAGARAARTARQ